MKSAITAWFVLLTILLVSCDPPRPDYPLVMIRGEVVNPKDSINLGDSIAFYFEVPDTIDYNGSRIATYVTNKDECSLSFMPEWINTNSGRIEGLLSGFYANPGSITNNIVFFLGTVNGSLKGKLYFIPRKKGAYYLEVHQNGFLGINNETIKANSSFYFGNIDRHEQIIVDNADTSYHISGIVQAKLAMGLEIYAFYVK